VISDKPKKEVLKRQHFWLLFWLFRVRRESPGILIIVLGFKPRVAGKDYRK